MTLGPSLSLHLPICRMGAVISTPRALQSCHGAKGKNVVQGVSHSSVQVQVSLFKLIHRQAAWTLLPGPWGDGLWIERWGGRW